VRLRPAPIILINCVRGSEFQVVVVVAAVAAGSSTHLTIIASAVIKVTAVAIARAIISRTFLLSTRRKICVSHLEEEEEEGSRTTHSVNLKCTLNLVGHRDPWADVNFQLQEFCQNWIVLHTLAILHGGGVVWFVCSFVCQLVRIAWRLEGESN